MLIKWRTLYQNAHYTKQAAETVTNNNDKPFIKDTSKRKNTDSVALAINTSPIAVFGSIEVAIKGRDANIGARSN